MTAFVLIFYESPAGAFPTSGQAPRTIFARGARLSYSALPACVAAGGPEGGPHAFFMVQEGVHTLGNFKRHLNP